MSCEKHRRNGFKAIANQMGVSAEKLEKVFQKNKGLIATLATSSKPSPTGWLEKKKEEALKELSSLSSALAELDERGDNESVTRMLTLISREEAQARKAKSPDLPKILTRLHSKIAALDARGEDEDITEGLTLVSNANERVNSADYKGAPTSATEVEGKYQGEIAAILARMPNRPDEAREMATMLTTKKQRARAEAELAESETEDVSDEDETPDRRWLLSQNNKKLSAGARKLADYIEENFGGDADLDDILVDLRVSKPNLVKHWDELVAGARNAS
ncbi:MAG: hypothetical protein AAB571_06025 [Chloroflexota bacterium]